MTCCECVEASQTGAQLREKARKVEFCGDIWVDTYSQQCDSGACSNDYSNNEYRGTVCAFNTLGNGLGASIDCANATICA